MRVLHIGFFSIGVFLEVYYYPALATAIDGLMVGTDGPGSSIGYFRDFYVLPVGIALGIGAAVAAISGPFPRKCIHG